MIQISGKYGLKADGTIWQIPNKNASSVIIQKDTKDVRFIKVASMTTSVTAAQLILIQLILFL